METNIDEYVLFVSDLKITVPTLDCLEALQQEAKH